jgi:ketosteroid isomerase-like protein
MPTVEVPDWNVIRPQLNERGVDLSKLSTYDENTIIAVLMSDNIDINEVDATYWDDFVTEMIENHPEWETAQGRRLRHAKEISAEWESNAYRSLPWVKDSLENYYVGEEPDVLSEQQYACIIRSDDQTWVLGADSKKEIGQIIAGTYENDGYSVEYLDKIFDLDTGEELQMERSVVITVVVGGEEYTTEEMR